MQNTQNYAFIDAQNLHLGINSLGWKLSYQKFRQYLKEKYKVEKAIMFIGYIEENKDIYENLKEYGYEVIFKPTLKSKRIPTKGNCDAELVLHSMIEFKNYDKAVIVTGDGDFYCLIEYLYKQSKLSYVLAPSRSSCSALLKRSGKEKLLFMDELKNSLRFNEKGPRVDLPT